MGMFDPVPLTCPHCGNTADHRGDLSIAECGRCRQRILPAMGAGPLGSLPHSGPRVGPDASNPLVIRAVTTVDIDAKIEPDLVRVPQYIRGADGVVREYGPVPTVVLHANRDGVAYRWDGVPKDRALSLFTPGVNPPIADLIRALGPCTADLLERVTVGGGG